MIFVEHGPGGAPAVFAEPRRVIRAEDAAAVAPALAELEAARAEGFWIAGFLSYEAGFLREPRLLPLLPADRALPLLAFGVFDAPADPAPFRARAAADAAGARLDAPAPQITPGDHARAVTRVLDYIAAGDVYQVNLTFPWAARWSGTAAGLYHALAQVQPVGHGAAVEMPDMPVLVSLSPELFFSTDAGGAIEARPMKGTRPRGRDAAEDARLSADLHASVKDRAENLMIVDLMRNDLSRICRVGSVRVPELFAVETYATVHQMTSRVTGRLTPGAGIDAILGAIFPCGSITGAPKIRAMEIIRDLEAGPRGAYCGAIGWAGPDGSSAFNVAIRTLTLWPDGRARFDVGGGIVADSTPEGEWEEALWKARFAQAI